MSKTAPYGTWDSPINGDTVVGKDNIVFDDVLVDPITRTIYHLEESPSDGRCIIIQTETAKEVLPSQYSARTLVQEYGGAPVIVYNDTIYFSNAYDNRIYTLKVGSNEATAVTPDDNLLRYANFALHPKQTNLLVTLREDHTNDPDGNNPRGVVNTICVVDTQATTPNVTVIIQGADFYATPVFNPSGNRIAWQQWGLPDMPWQGGIIYVADVVVDSTSLTVSQNPVLVAGEKGTVAATFPYWITDTTLAYTSDGGNKYQNPYVFNTEENTSTPVLNQPLEQDFAEPAWYLGYYPYAILGDGQYGAFTAFEKGANILYIIDLTAQSAPVSISWDFTVAQHVRTVDGNTFVFTGSKASAPGGVVRGTVTADGSNFTVVFDVLKYSADTTSPVLKYISKPNPMTLTGSGSHPIHVVRYDPYNPDYSGSSITEKPPCILHVHGGPTGLEPQALNWTKMFYTSRGFTWLDVNYRGSSGYGREYSDLLNGNWGRYDLQDCQEAATALAADSYIDVNRVAIRGGSAGAYTTLSSLTFAPDPIPTFYKSACGAYGCVADVETLAQVSEKFEIEYTWTLFGCPPDNGAWDPWNPIKHASNIQRPLLVLQGLDDGVVHPDMLRSFLSQSTDAGPSGAFTFYPGEGHHWHLESTIRNSLGREHHWYQDTLV